MKVTKADGTVIENVYDVDGVLVRTAVNGVGVEYLVDTSGGLSHVVAEVDSSGAVTALYVRAGDMLLEEIRGGVAKMYEADGLGSVRGLLDVSGAKTDTYSYEAFGTTVNTTGTDANPYRFAGERLVDSVGLYQNRARWLDARMGRFLGPDPDEGFAKKPKTLHRYLYSDADPVNRTDASGRFSMGEASAIVASIAIVATVAYLGARAVLGPTSGDSSGVTRGASWKEILQTQRQVAYAIEEAWQESLPGDPDHHEEGGWVYVKPRTGIFVTDRAPPGGPDYIRLDCPPIKEGYVLVADFHTHPLLESQGGILKPSDHDLNTVYGVPALIRHERSSANGDPWAAVGYRIYGPERRELLAGNPGYPGLPPPGRAASCP